MSKQKIAVTTRAFEPEGMIPSEYTCDGADSSPDLAWSGAPDGTKSFAVTCEDPDAPGGTFTHWVLFNLPATRTSLDAKLSTSETLPDGSRQGKNSFNKIGYSGPCPPKQSTHRYYFHIYALDTVLDAAAGVSKVELVSQMKGHILAEGSVMGRYRRK